MSEIWERRHILDKARREYMMKVMKEYDIQHNAALKKLREDCESSTHGHNYKFSNFGPLDHPWYYCSYCAKTRVGTADE